MLRAPVPVEIHEGCKRRISRSAAGDRLAFVLAMARRHRANPGPIDAEAALAATQAYWRDWIGRFDDGKTQWPAAVRRSLITLKALIYRPSGGLVAAPRRRCPKRRVAT